MRQTLIARSLFLSARKRFGTPYGLSRARPSSLERRRSGIVGSRLIQGLVLRPSTSLTRSSPDMVLPGERALSQRMVGTCPVPTSLNQNRARSEIRVHSGRPGISSGVLGSNPTGSVRNNSSSVGPPTLLRAALMVFLPSTVND